jgi:hypothetical protein
VINESEEGDLAAVEIKYFIKNKSGDWLGGSTTKETKKINLIKEKDGWRLKDLYCELV